jgi:hypothetical protein
MLILPCGGYGQNIAESDDSNDLKYILLTFWLWFIFTALGEAGICPIGSDRFCLRPFLDLFGVSPLCFIGMLDIYRDDKLIMIQN